MGALRTFCLVFAFAVLAVVNVKVAMSILHAKDERRVLSGRVDSLAEKHRQAKDDFLLRQEHMRRLLTDKNFIRQVIWQKEGYINPREMVFKFEGSK
jgi:hypothetical protein